MTTSEEQGGYRNTDTLFLGCDSNQQGLDLQNRDALEAQPSLSTFIPKERDDLVHCHISRSPEIRVDRILQSSTTSATSLVLLRVILSHLLNMGLLLHWLSLLQETSQ
jgi:hypothetical protein